MAISFLLHHAVEHPSIEKLFSYVHQPTIANQKWQLVMLLLVLRDNRLHRLLSVAL